MRASFCALSVHFAPDYSKASFNGNRSFMRRMARSAVSAYFGRASAPILWFCFGKGNVAPDFGFGFGGQICLYLAQI
jgi:hypothetical protein